LSTPATAPTLGPLRAAFKNLRVLYVHPAGPFGGASKSLLDTVKQLDGVDARLVCPRGETLRRAREQGLQTLEVTGLSQLDNTSFGGYRGLRKLVLLRELALLPSTLWALFQARKRWQPIDLVHVNEVTLVLLVPVLRLLFPSVPVIVHVRSTQKPESGSFKSRLIFSILRRHVARVVPIDETVRATLPPDLLTTVIHNGFSTHSLNSHALSRPISRSPTPLVLSYVGGLMAAKGIFELIEAARLCHERGVNIRWRIFGDNVRNVSGFRARLLGAMGLNADVRTQVMELIKRHGLEEVVTLEGHQSDYARIYGETDVVLCITHANAAGRPVFEGAFFGRPSIIAIDKPAADTAIADVTAICIPARSPEDLANAAARMQSDRPMVEQMGKAARAMAHENFRQEHCAARLSDLYAEITAAGPTGPQ
jgi:glycosyltransferase involved in cell wall biosynthesis